ncbi:MAG: Ig-like domain-containing protein, partial [Planctomycetota bacterium]
MDITLTTVDDAVGEADEDAVLTIAAGAYTIGTPSAAAITITDDDVPPPTPYFEWDAALDTGGDTIWPSTTANAYDWTFDAGAQTPVDVVNSRFMNVTKAYAFPGARDEANSHWDGYGSTQSASFEFVIDIDGDNGLLFETGGGTGISFDITAGVIRGCYGGDTVTYTPTAEEKNDFLHVVFVVDFVGDVFQLYVDDALVDSVAGIDTDWSGTNGAGLGGSNSTVNGGDPGDFAGKMALFRFYRNMAITSAEVGALFNLLGLNLAPTVSITSPDEGATFDSGADVTITASASDDDGAVTGVQ